METAVQMTKPLSIPLTSSFDGRNTPIDLTWESLQRLLDEGLAELIFAHWEEVGVDKDVVQFDPDYEHFLRLEKAGSFKIMAMRRLDKLIGYNGFLIHPHPHYRKVLHALNDVIYVDPEERGRSGVRMIKTAEHDLFEWGVKRIMYHSKEHVKVGSKDGTLGDLLALLGYAKMESTYTKVRRG